MAVHELTLTAIEDVAVCADCHRAVRYNERHDFWVHVDGSGFEDCAGVEFSGLRVRDADVGDGLVLVTPQGSWLADVYDIDDYGVHAIPW